MENKLIPYEGFTPEQNAEVLNKSSVWAENGRAMTKNKIAIENEVRIKLEGLTVPTDITKLAEYDEERKGLRAWYAAMVDKRKVDTDKLNTYISSRMAPEKEIDAFLKKYDDALLEIKKTAATIKAAEEKAAAEKADTRAKFEALLNEHKVRNEELIQTTILDYYKRALEHPETNEITEPMMAKMAFNFGKGEVFNIIPPADMNEEQKAIWNEVTEGYSVAPYLTRYITLINDKFKHFSDDKKNATEAIAQATFESEQVVEKAKDEAELNNVMSAATAMAVSSDSLTTPHKALKKSFAVVMSETPTATELQEIDKAFLFVNGYTSMTRIKDMWKLTMLQKAAFIGKCKTDDNNLVVGNVEFKEVEKL